MEHGFVNTKFIVAGVLAMIAACVMAAPALSQANAQGGDVQINVQYCPQVVSQYASADQSNSGGDIAAGIAQELGISQNAVNTCLQNEAGDGGDDGDDSETTTPAEDQYDNDDNGTDDGEDSDREVNTDGVILATIPDKVLANTGGVSASSVLLPAGALLVASGVMAMMWVGRRRG